MKRPLLLFGPIVGMAVEAYETALALGYEPINVVWARDQIVEGMSSRVLPDLSVAERTMPALIVGHPLYPDLVGLRLDRRWCGAVVRARAELEKEGVSNWTSLTHPSAVISPSARVGRGVIVGPAATVSSESDLADFVTVGRSSSVGHHSAVGEYSRVGPGVIIPGDVRIGSRVVVGPGATFVNGIRICDEVLIGAGSVVTRHVRAPAQIMGNPARPLRRPISVVRRALRRSVITILRRTGLYAPVRRWYRSRLG